MAPLNRCLTAVLCLPLFVACAATHQGQGASSDPKASESAPEGREKGEPKSEEERAFELQKKTQAKELAALELEVTRRKAESELGAAAHAVAQAEFEAQAAESALSFFRDSEAPRQVATKQLTVDGAVQRLAQQREELQQMIEDYADYGDDEAAAKTRDIVLSRERVQIEFAERRLELARQELAALEGHELPRKAAELERKHARAVEALGEARAAAERTELSTKVQLLRAEQKVHEAEHDLEEAREEADA